MALYRLTKTDVANIKYAMRQTGQEDWMEPVFRSLSNPVPEKPAMTMNFLRKKADATKPPVHPCAKPEHLAHIERMKDDPNCTCTEICICGYCVKRREAGIY